MSITSLLTGATGFLGRIIHEHQQVRTLRLGRGAQNDIRCDLSREVPGLPEVHAVIHNAGKAHVVPRTPKEADEFHAVNYQGTLHLLEGLKAKPPRRFVLISTVAVYGCERGERIDEGQVLAGETPYAKSKIRAERAVREWCTVREVPYLILRLPLVVGEGAPGNLGAISRMIRRGRYVRIGQNPARKSMVLARDVAALLAQPPQGSGTYNLTDGVHPSFQELEQAIAAAHGRKLRLQLPPGLLRRGARVGDQLRDWKLPFPLYSERLDKMMATLTFSDDKARRELGWAPTPVLEAIPGMKI